MKNPSERYSCFKFLLTLLAVLVFSIVGCGAALADADRSSNAPAISERTDKSMKTMTLEAGARLLQNVTPVQQLQTYLDGFHNYKNEANLPGESQHQMRVSHYCQNLNEDFIQCAVYDGNMQNSHLIGIEYVISDGVYGTLAEREKQYWHSHIGEVDSGLVIAPGIPAPAHKALMDKMRTTHGKTWHVWDTQKVPDLPLGEPVLMWSIEPNQINKSTQQMMQAREKAVEF